MKTLIINTKKRIFGQLAGNHLSKLKGEGLDFRELREYNYQEDARKIDWKISAKLQKPYVKEFDETKELNIIILYLLSGSIHFGSLRLKSELALEIMGLLGFSAVKFGDKVSFIIYDTKPLRFKPTKTINGVSAAIENISKINLIKKDYDFYFIDYLNKLKKSILFIIGDFYKIPPLNRLKHETYVVIIRDKFEERPEFKGYVELIDPISLKETNINFNSYITKKYQDFIKKHDLKLTEFLKSKKIKFTKIYTDEDPFFKLKEMLK